MDGAYPTQTRPDVFHGAVGTGDGKGDQQQRRVGEMNVYDLMDVWIDDFDLYNMWLILAEMP